jgi:oligoendopeptidase F
MHGEINMVKMRSDVLPQDQWNVEQLYSSPKEWEKAFRAFVPEPARSPYWPILAEQKGTLSQGPDKVKEALDMLMDIDRELSKLYTYAHLRHDEDIANPEFKKMYEQIIHCAHTFVQESSWFQPELLSLQDSLLQHYLNSTLLQSYRFHLEKLLRIKPHTLTPENERIIALAGQALQTPHKAFSAINDADFDFGVVLDSDDNEKVLTHGLYGIYIRDQDRKLRENAFKKYHEQYLTYENTLCELLTGQMQVHLFNAKARHYGSCLEAALFPKNIDTSVYYALIQAVHERIDVLHRYMDMRKGVLGLDQLHLYDIYVPLTSEVDIRMSYQEAEDIVIESVAPLGTEYQNLLKKGFKEQRWVDRYENKNKRSGAYSSGCFDSMPYILMNYKDLLRDVFTLAHEAGHSMHSLYSRTYQPYHYSDYPIFLAEVASTFNEDLLTRLLLERCQNPAEKIFLLNQKIEDVRGTLFRQTMFAEFELLLHQKVEQGIPLTPQLLKEEYHQLNVKYFGPSTFIDEEIDIEWARIPHFYYNFYVFQYATGISAALALSDRVIQGGEQERKDYLNFLKGGCSQYPLEMLKMAGIDMSTPAPVKAAIQKFENWLNELEKLILPVVS